MALRLLETIGQISDPTLRDGAMAKLLASLSTRIREEITIEIAKTFEKSPTDEDQTPDPASISPNVEALPQQQSYLPPIAGYISDRAGQELQDLLNIKREVANIANVLTFKQVQPPLALGLFGDWGSGKTFFMGKLQKYVTNVSQYYQQQEQTDGVESMWCSRVAQIEFNAWHFSDSNLWASLVTRIYEGLDRELNKEKETVDEIKKRIIEAQIKEATEKSIKAVSQLDQAKTRVNNAEENLKKKKEEREVKENSLTSLIGNIPDLLTDQDYKTLEKATNALGLPEAAKTYESLEELDGQLKNFSGRLTAILATLVYSPSTLLLTVLFVVAAPILLTLAVEYSGDWLTETGKRVTEISTFLLLVIGWLQAQVRRGLKVVESVESALKKAREIRQEKIENDKKVIAAKKALVEAQTEEQAAQTNLEMAQTELQRLQDALQELRPERKLQRLIEARANSGAYAQHLGIISLIRSDFENMSRILADMVAERRDFKKAPPVQRIILYIDDLDRCKPERVVEVLEAIHLLLYFPLFVVVVAVDPRWLRHSLAHHYPDTLNENGGANSTQGDSSWGMSSSTPQDYLEKIFQIPFALRPIEKDGYKSLINDLLNPLPAQARREESKAPSPTPKVDSSENTGGQDVNAFVPAQDGPNIALDTQSPSEEVEHTKITQETSAKPIEDTFEPIPARQLEFTKREREDIERLWPMFHTPRTVKRFVNIYRLLRAGLTSDEEVKKFEGTEKNPGEYQIAVLLLAAITAFPNVATELLHRLDAWLDKQEAENKNRDTNWEEVVNFLKQISAASISQASAKEKRHPGALKDSEQEEQPNEGVSSIKWTDDEQNPQSSWVLMINCLTAIIQENELQRSFKVSTLRIWVVRVGRFSFSVQPI